MIAAQKSKVNLMTTAVVFSGAARFHLPKHPAAASEQSLYGFFLIIWK